MFVKLIKRSTIYKNSAHAMKDTATRVMNNIEVDLARRTYHHCMK